MSSLPPQQSQQSRGAARRRQRSTRLTVAVALLSLAAVLVLAALAALLRRRLVFMTGLYRGGNRYDLRFAELADFSTASAEQRDALIGTALARYVATLEELCREAPYNWFNFYDFWSDAPTDPQHQGPN